MAAISDRNMAQARTLILLENLMCAADEVTENLRREHRQSLTCPRHRRTESHRPTLCPVCALVECRKRGNR